MHTIARSDSANKILKLRYRNQHMGQGTLDTYIGLAVGLVLLLAFLDALFFGFVIPIDPWFDQLPADTVV